MEGVLDRQSRVELGEGKGGFPPVLCLLKVGSGTSWER